MVHLDSLQRWLTLLGLLAAALAALGYLIRKAVWLVRVVEALHQLVDHELTHNGGSSMKDDVASIARAVGELQGEVRDLRIDKEAEHRALQLQLDGLVHELGPHEVVPRHKREDNEG